VLIVDGHLDPTWSAPQVVAGLLPSRGYTAAEVAAVMHGNWLRVLSAALPES
jgi:microsomal dipeptidase-like Zn-dependent dipeptidase